MIRKLILIQGLPKSGKTTISRKIEEKVKERGKTAIIVPVDFVYVKFVKEKRPYMLGEDFNKNIQWHYEKLNDESKRLFTKYLQTKILQQEADYVIVEGWHLMTMINDIKLEFINTFAISEIVMREENNCLLMKGLSVIRDVASEQFDFIL